MFYQCSLGVMFGQIDTNNLDALAAPLVFVDTDTLEVIGIMPGNNSSVLQLTSVLAEHGLVLPL
ncbi:hypothetical protein [Bacillus sp. NP247]|uniref:hypothetical protein n=1 Tax=Bacillus sp. NP247 TaxID=2846779 RepID=UPI001C62D9EF|nr:hypothetical protein [Bacillus sp. NP247]QWU44670.1 hypothetical protein KPL75_23310 [Bacillus sp. NP247]